VSASLAKMLRDESGASFVEFTVVMMTLMVTVLGFVDFSYVFYQWNSATKAVQYGARLAAVSDPVASGLRGLSGVSSTVLPGMAMPTFAYECKVTAGNGACTGAPSYSGFGFSLPALQKIVYGRDSTGAPNEFCVDGQKDRRLQGMCNFYNRIDIGNVVIRYDYTGLGYAGRPGGPVPTITVSLQNIPYNYVFLGNLLGLDDINLPGFATTVTGEDLKVTGT
jgi:Flp pilus assembly protein TadG